MFTVRYKSSKTHNKINIFEEKIEKSWWDERLELRKIRDEKDEQQLIKKLKNRNHNKYLIRRWILTKLTCLNSVYFVKVIYTYLKHI